MSSFNSFAQAYDSAMGDSGDYTHRNTIDPALFKLMGQVEDKVIYDIACGNGYIARRLIREGAKTVWASDIASELIHIAQTKYPHTAINYFVCDANDFSHIPKQTFDLIVMNMAIFYIENLNTFIAHIAASLKPGGSFLFSADHPLKTAAYRQLSLTSEEQLNDTETQYLKSRPEQRRNHWMPDQPGPIQYHRPLEDYIACCSRHNLFISGFAEPPTDMHFYQGEPRQSSIPTKMVIKATMVPSEVSSK